MVYLIGLWPHGIDELREVATRLDAHLVDIRSNTWDRNPNHDGKKIAEAFPDRYHHIPLLGNSARPGEHPAVERVADGVDAMLSRLDGRDAIAFCVCPRSSKCHRPIVSKELHRRKVACKLADWRDFPKPEGVRWDYDLRREVVDKLCQMDRWADAHPGEMTQEKWDKIGALAAEYEWAECLVELLLMTDGLTHHSIRALAVERGKSDESLFAAVGRMEARGELEFKQERNPYNSQEYIGSWRRVDHASEEKGPAPGQPHNLSLFD